MSLGPLEALLGFSRRDDEPGQPGDLAVPGYPDNRIVQMPCAIRDARKVDASLDREGFQLARHNSAYLGERDKSTLARDYHKEMAIFLKEYLGASTVLASAGSALLVRYGARLVGRHQFEWPTDIIDDRIPASFGHVDYYPDVALGSAQAMGAPEDYERFMLVQTWRAVSGAPQDVPLAICDRRTLDDADLSPRTGILAPENAPGMDDPFFTIAGIHHNPAQQWHYYPDMEPDEVLLFTGFDSAHEDGWKVGHGAFDNRHTDPGGIARISFEARFYAFFN